MRIKVLSVLLISVVIVLTAGSIVMSLVAYELVERRREARQALVDAVGACEMLARGSDALTDAVRAYAVTGDERHRHAFQAERDHNRSRERALEKLRTLDVTTDELERLETAKLGADAMAPIEARVFQAVQQKDFATATALAWGAEYAAAKDRSLELVRTTRSDMHTRLLSKADYYSRIAHAVKIGAFVAYGANLLTVVLALGWFFQRRVVTPVTELTTKTRRLMAGESGVLFDLRHDHSEIGELARALDDLRQSQEEVGRQRWIKNALVEIVASAQAADTLEAFGRRVLERLAPLLHAAAAAVFFRAEAAEPLACVGTFALGRGLAAQDLAHAEGLAAESLASGRPMIVTEIPPEHLRVATALGESAPTALLLVPIPTAGGRAAAFVELATFSPPSDEEWGLVQELPSVLAPHLELLLRSRDTERLLAATQAQARELELRTSALRSAHGQLEAIFESTSSGIALLEKGVVVRCNRRMEEMYGFAPGELLGRTMRACYLDESTWSSVDREISECLSCARGFTREVQHLRRDGTSFWTRMSAQAADKADLSSGVVGVFTDITAERDIKESLEKAAAAAEAANQAKSAFLANMSHEIRTPMNAVLGYTQLLQRDVSLSDTQRDHLDVISRSGYHLLDIINDVLEMSRIEAGRGVVEARDFDFHGLLSDLSAMFRLRMAEKSLAFSLEFDGSVPRFLHSDPRKVKQVLINVIGNALKFTDHGGIDVRVEVSEACLPEMEVSVSISDTGMGIPEHELQRIFEAFHQADGGLQKGGTGLGMAISRQHARMLGGDLSVTSRIGVGSVFCFRFRALVTNGNEDSARRSIRAPVGLAPGSVTPHILVVDDLRLNRDIVCHLLSDLGFRVTEASNGRECLEQIDLERPDLVLMDWVMPEMNGLEATRRIRASEMWRDLPIVMLTASAMEESRHEAGSAGVDGYLRKPLLLGEILLLIERLVPGVRLEYAEVAGVDDPADASSSVVSLVGRLPEGLRVALSALIEGGRVDAFVERVRREVGPIDGGLARHLERLAHQFAYRDILQVLSLEAGLGMEQTTRRGER